MKLIVSKSIQATELSPNADIFPLDVIKTAAIKAIGGLGKKIKSSSKISGTQLKKISLTSSNGAGRVLFLLKVDKTKAVLVMLRHKNDKQIGANMSVANPKFKSLLEKNIDILLRDLEAGNYEEIDLS
jgi:phage-related protein